MLSKLSEEVLLVFVLVTGAVVRSLVEVNLREQYFQQSWGRASVVKLTAHGPGNLSSVSWNASSNGSHITHVIPGTRTVHASHGSHGFHVTDRLYLLGFRTRHVFLHAVTCAVTSASPVDTTSKTIPVHVTPASLSPWVGTRLFSLIPGETVNLTCSVGVLRNTFSEQEPFSTKFFYANFLNLTLYMASMTRVAVTSLTHLDPPPGAMNDSKIFRDWYGNYCTKFREKQISGQTCRTRYTDWWVFSISIQVFVTKSEQDARYECDAENPLFTKAVAVFFFNVQIPPMMHLEVAEWADEQHVHIRRVTCHADGAKPAVDRIRWHINGRARWDMRHEHVHIHCGIRDSSFPNIYLCDTRADLTLRGADLTRALNITCMVHHASGIIGKATILSGE